MSGLLQENRATRVVLAGDPYAAMGRGRSWIERGIWPCSWIACPGAEERPSAAAYRRAFETAEAATVRINVAADERYELFLDGIRVGRGGERGDPENWFFDTYDLELTPGPHLLAARVWALGAAGPRSQMTLRPGFLLSPQGEPWISRIGTGTSAWEARLLPGYRFTPPFDHPYYSIGHNVTLDGMPFPWGWETEGGVSWKAPRVLHPGSGADERTRVGGEHLLRPAILPPLRQREWRGGQVRSAVPLPTDVEDLRQLPVRESGIDNPDRMAWRHLWEDGDDFVVAPGTAWRIIVDLEDYLCAYPSLSVSGGKGGRVRLFWAEALFDDPEGKGKGHRDRVDGKYFHGVGDTFLPEGGARRRFDPPFWRAGRYLEIVAAAGAEPLILHRPVLTETRYPLDTECSLRTEDPRWDRFVARAERTLRASCHDGYVDPYYEQMMWAGDGVQNILATFVLTGDDRLPRKLLRSFDASRLSSGLTRARHPARDALLIAPYALYWVQMIREFAFWRGDAVFIRALMPGARGVLDAFDALVGGDGLLSPPPGWNFVDWVPAWGQWGIPPGADRGPNAILHWHFVHTLTLAAGLEEALSEPERGARLRRRAGKLAAAGIAAFWCEKRGLFADDTARTTFSEHAQAYAVLSGAVPAPHLSRLRDALRGQANPDPNPKPARATISFGHHLFEAYNQLGCPDGILERMPLWFDLDRLGFLTLPEAPEPSRSDCHSWSTHPLYHAFASILGIRPSAFGFARVAISPQLGPLERISGTIPHPHGTVAVALCREMGRLRGTVTLPEGIEGTFSAGGATLSLRAGTQDIDLPAGE